MRLKNQVPKPRRAEDEEQIDLEPEQLTLIKKKTKRATSSRRLDAATHRESRNTDLNRHDVPERWKMDKSTSPVSLLWMETVQLLYA